MIIETLSTFPNMYDSVMGSSMMRIAQDKGILEFCAYDLRDWTHDRHRTTDDDPYGGGDGLVMKCEPIFEAVEDITGDGGGHAQSLRQSCSHGSATGASGSCGTRLVGMPAPVPCESSVVEDPAHASMGAAGLGAGGVPRAVPHDENGPVDRSPKQDRLSMACPRPQAPLADGEPVAALPRPHIVFLAPQGERFTDALACELAREERLLFVCGHYEGIDERVYELADRVVSLGDYVLTSGELASMVVIDAVVRKLPGVLGAATGAQGESFADGLLEYPQYTRPADFRGREVPAVLLSGDHGAVARWRREQSLSRTARLRPDLLERAELSDADRDFLQSLSTGEGA